MKVMPILAIILCTSLRNLFVFKLMFLDTLKRRSKDKLMLLFLLKFRLYQLKSPRNCTIA